MSKTAKKVVLTGKVNAQEWVKANNGYPEKGLFADEKTLQKFYKQLTEDQLQEWLGIEGLSYKQCPESPAIDRMRACMTILYYHFPKETTSTAKPKSKYAGYTTEQLVQMCIDHEIAFELTDNAQILRMRAVMALRANKVIE